MASVQLFQYFVLTIDERQVQGGSLSQARTVTLTDDEVIQQTFKIAAETAVKIFDVVENESLGGFDFCWIESDLDVLIQLTNDNDEYFLLELKGSGTANEMGPAIVLGSNATQLQDGTIDTFDGTAGTVAELWAYNEDDTDTARVMITVAT